MSHNSTAISSGQPRVAPPSFGNDDFAALPLTGLRLPLGPPVIAADSSPASLEKAGVKAPLKAKPLTAAVYYSADDIRVEIPPKLLEEPVAPETSVEPAVEPGDLGEPSSIAAEVREIAPDDFFHCLLMRLSVQEPKLFQWHIELIIFKSIPCVMFAIGGPSSFQK